MAQATTGDIPAGNPGPEGGMSETELHQQPVI
jgi:hypothetical protein